MLDGLQRRVAGTPVDLFIAFEHQLYKVQHSRHSRIRRRKRRHCAAVERLDHLKSDWKRRPWVPQSLDHVREVPGQHVVVSGSNVDMLGFASG